MDKTTHRFFYRANEAIGSFIGTHRGKGTMSW